MSNSDDKRPVSRSPDERSDIRVRSSGFTAAPGFRFAHPGYETLYGSLPANKRKRNAGRRVVHDLYASGAQGAPRRRRLAPPFRFGRARLPAFHHGTCGSDRTPPLSSSSRASWNGATEERVLSVPCRPSTAGDVARRPVVVPAGRFGPEPPGSGADNPARGNRTRPCPPVSPGGVLTGEIGVCNWTRDICQGCRRDKCDRARAATIAS